MRGFHFFIAMNNITFFSYTTCFFTYSSVNGHLNWKTPEYIIWSDRKHHFLWVGFKQRSRRQGYLSIMSGACHRREWEEWRKSFKQKVPHSLTPFIYSPTSQKKQRDTNKWFPQCFPFPQWFPQWFESALFHSLVFLTPLSGNFYYCVIKTLSFFLKIIIEKNWSFAITKLTAFVDVSNTLCFVTSFAKYIVSCLSWDMNCWGS